MQFTDIILLTIIGLFALAGLWFGLVHTLGSLMGTVLGVFLASRYYEVLATWIMSLTGWSGNLPRVVSFIVAFIIINRLIGFIFWIVDKVLSVVTHLPFINSLNRLLGLVFGFFEGFVTVGIAIYFIERFPLSQTIMTHLSTSIVAPYTLSVASILVPLLPEAIKILHSTVDYVENVVQ